MDINRKKIKFAVKLQLENGEIVSPLATPECFVRGEYKVIELEIYEDDMLKEIIEVQNAKIS